MELKRYMLCSISIMSSLTLIQLIMGPGISFPLTACESPSIRMDRLLQKTGWHRLTSEIITWQSVSRVKIRTLKMGTSIWQLFCHNEVAGQRSYVVMGWVERWTEINQTLLLADILGQTISEVRFPLGLHSCRDNHFHFSAPVSLIWGSLSFVCKIKLTNTYTWISSLFFMECEIIVHS